MYVQMLVQSIPLLGNLPMELKLLGGVFLERVIVKDVPGQVLEKKISMEK